MHKTVVTFRSNVNNIILINNLNELTPLFSKYDREKRYLFYEHTNEVHTCLCIHTVCKRNCIANDLIWMRQGISTVFYIHKRSISNSFAVLYIVFISLYFTIINNIRLSNPKKQNTLSTMRIQGRS